MSNLTDVLRRTRINLTKIKRKDKSHDKLPRNYRRLLGKVIEYHPENDPNYVLGHRPY